MKKKTTLCCSPIRNSEYSLYAYLRSLDDLHFDGDKIYYFITEDNDDNTYNILEKFMETHEGEIVSDSPIDDYELHSWSKNRLKKMGELRNRCLQYGLEKKVDYVYMVDADLMLNEYTLIRLIELSEGEHVTSTVCLATWDWRDPRLTQVTAAHNYLVAEDNLTGIPLTIRQMMMDFEENEPRDCAVAYMNHLIPIKLIESDIADFSSPDGEMEFKWFDRRLRDKGVRHIIDFKYPTIHLEESGICAVYFEDYK